MSVKIRLARYGTKKKPFYRIVVASTQAPRDGRFLELVGTYDPVTDTWTVTFNNAYFDIDWWGLGGDNGKHVVWDGNLTFTVIVQKMPET